MYYLIYRPCSDLADESYLLYSTTGRETPWCLTAVEALTERLTDLTASCTIEDRVYNSNWIIYGPYTDRPTPESHPELLI